MATQKQMSLRCLRYTEKQRERANNLDKGQRKKVLAAWRLRFCKLAAFFPSNTPSNTLDADDDDDFDAGTH